MRTPQCRTTAFDKILDWVQVMGSPDVHEATWRAREDRRILPGNPSDIRQTRQIGDFRS